jgi:hypothetical protein
MALTAVPLAAPASVQYLEQRYIGWALRIDTETGAADILLSSNQAAPHWIPLDAVERMTVKDVSVRK